MKYCAKCGKELMDEAVICMGCGCKVEDSELKQTVSRSDAQNGKPKVSMILGIVGIVGAWLFALAGHIVSIIGIVIGVKEYKQTNNITGLILSIVGEVCSIISSIIGMAIMSGF